MNSITKFIDALNKAAGKVFCYMIYAMIGVVVYEVVSRKVFMSPTTWAFDMIGYLGGAFFLSGLGYCMLHDSHVRIDVILMKMPCSLRRVLNIATFFIFFLPFALGLFYAGWEYAADSWAQGELGQSSWKPPLYIPKTFIPIGFGLLLVQGVSNFLKNLKEK